MGYYQAARITPCHGHLPYATHIYPPGTPGTRRQASQTRLRMFDIEEMGPNMAMDQLVPGPREIVSAGCCFSPPKKLRSFFIAFRSFLYLNSLNTSSTVFQYISIYFNIKIQLIQGFLEFYRFVEPKPPSLLQAPLELCDRALTNVAALMWLLGSANLRAPLDQLQNVKVKIG